jgi:MerR family transcriptional regulator, light-induced transcriptional regulator
MIEEPSTTGHLRIGQLADRVGVSSAVLRAWERRYGLLEPARTARGYRLYGAKDEERVRSMLALLAAGVAAREAAGIVRAESAAGIGEPARDDTGAEAGHALGAALERFDEAAAHAELDSLLSRYTAAAVFSTVALPYLADLGDRWAKGQATVAQEHFASTLIRGRLLGVSRGWDSGYGPRAILACPHGERHDIGLLSFGLVLRELGWRITFLGADTPSAGIAETAQRLQCSAVVLSLTVRERRPAFDVSLPPRTLLAIGGRAATDAIADRFGALLLGRELRSAAAELDRAAVGDAA